MNLLPQVEPETTTPEQTVAVEMTLQDAETISHIRLIVHDKMQDEPYWGQVVLELLTTYTDRGKSLPDWWVWSRFLSTFGTLVEENHVVRCNMWMASDTLDQLLQCHEALELYRSWSWRKRWQNRRLYREANRNFDQMLRRLRQNDEHWCDRHDFMRYKAKLHG